MHATLYSSRAWRELPRDYCLVELLLGPAAEPCSGVICHHHVDPEDPGSRTIQVCSRHHPMVEALLTRLRRKVKHCPHPPGTHRYEGAREACERRLNAAIP